MNIFYISTSSGFGFYKSRASILSDVTRCFYNGVTDSVYLTWK